MVNGVRQINKQFCSKMLNILFKDIYDNFSPLLCSENRLELLIKKFVGEIWNDNDDAWGCLKTSIQTLCLRVNIFNFLWKSDQGRGSLEKRIFVSFNDLCVNLSAKSLPFIGGLFFCGYQLASNGEFLGILETFMNFWKFVWILRN